jgi:hypothetical protein
MERGNEKDELERLYLIVFLGDNLLTALGLYTFFTLICTIHGSIIITHYTPSALWVKRIWHIFPI